MSTRSSARNLFPPLDNPELTIRRRSCTDPTLLNDSKMATEGNDDLPVPDLRTMKELCQPSLNSRVNGVTDDALRLYLFPHSLTHHATVWFDRLPRNSINTFEKMAKMFLGKYFPPSMVTKLRNEITNFRQRPNESLFEAWEHYKLSIDRCPNHNMLPVTQIDTFYNGLTLRHRDTINAAAGGTFMKRRPKECYVLIENMTAHHNNWVTSAQRSESSSSITSSFDTKIAALKAKMAEINKNIMRVLQVNKQVKAVTPNCETYGGPHSFSDCPATVGNTQNVYAARAYQGNSYQPQGNRNLLRTKTGIKETIILQGITKEGTNSSKELTKQVVTTNEFTNFMKANDAILKNMQTNMSSLTNSNLELKNMFGQFMKMNTTSSSGSRTLPGNIITNPKEDLKDITTRSGTPYHGPTIPTTSSSIPLVVEREIEATKDTVHPTNNGSTEDVQPLVVPTESQILNSEPVIAPIIEPIASPVTLADLGASINLMPLSVWNKLSLPDLSPTCMTLDLAGRLISHPVGIVEDVFVKVGTFYFPADFVVVDFDADPRVPLILGRSFLKTKRALIDVFEEVLDFFDVIASGNATPYYDSIVSTTFLTLTPFGESDFLLKDDPTASEVDHDEPLEVKVKDLPPHLEYIFLEGDDKFPVIIIKDLSVEEKTALITVLKSHKRAIACKLFDIKGIHPNFYTHKILMEEDFEPTIQHQRRVNPKIHDVIKNEVLKLLDAGLIYPISDSPWVNPVQCVLKKGSFTVVENEENELISTHLVTGWRVCINYHGFSGYFQIPIDPKDQEKTTFTCPLQKLSQMEE
uniref:Reverse transcriptase domain-containing protein n=1 Tax=Tanacetum cinerariifolium TaxID=118510 RepID=A0A699H4Z4_TANCI|nr:reverse transcriptase domain-containing protein [Tanacetum cinerariifolium]